MKLYKKVIILICATVLLIVGGYSIYSSNIKQKAKAPENTVQNATVNLTILDNSSKEMYKGTVNISSNMNYGLTALQALDSSNVSYITKGTGDMVYVSVIEDIQASGNGGWMYKVNDIAPNVGAGKYILKNGDTVLWYYGTF